MESNNGSKPAKTDNELIDAFYVSQGGIPTMKEDLSFYESDWGMLMDVVDKINRLSGNNPFLESRVVINGTKCKIVCGTRIFKVHTIKTINSVYGCVVQFVKHWFLETDTSQPYHSEHSNASRPID